ncbi:rhodanese-like domain-containing protein [Thalassotalea atypica]|uniref:rhodanese-like domain-containing protein n=1 Tax=Thalassotalea atypica TaxID=2054316 RepID=UPI00257450E4|nr:rhodanese-like domain-containing protein [Thalassotalea atypica]
MLKKIPELVKEARVSLNVITAKEAAIKVKEVNGLVLDVREMIEVDKKPVQGVINIPRGILEPQMLQRFPDENLPLFLHCASGVRATFSAEQLTRVGYKNVTVISCSIDDVCQAFA